MTTTHTQTASARSRKTTAPTPRAKTPRRSRERQENLWGYAFLAPWLLGLLLVVAGPGLISLYLSFTDYTVLGDPSWTGLSNYREMFTEDPRFWAAVKVTAIHLVVSVPLVQVFALFLATILNQGVRGLTLYRALFYVPSLIGGSVAIANLWRFLFAGDGLLNSILGIVGVESTYSWVGMPDTALYTLILLNVWQFGAAMIIYLAGLKQVPAELRDAAMVDGASAFRTYISITLPVLSPIILFNVLMNVVAALQAFNAAYIISNGTGGPADSTLFYTLYVYQRGFVDFDMGYASALGWVLLAVSAVVSAALFALSSRFVYYGDEA